MLAVQVPEQVPCRSQQIVKGGGGGLQINPKRKTKIAKMDSGLKCKGGTMTEPLLPPTSVALRKRL